MPLVVSSLPQPCTPLLYALGTHCQLLQGLPFLLRDVLQSPMEMGARTGGWAFISSLSPKIKMRTWVPKLLAFPCSLPPGLCFLFGFVAGGAAWLYYPVPVCLKSKISMVFFFFFCGKKGRKGAGRRLNTPKRARRTLCSRLLFMGHLLLLFLRLVVWK